MMSQGGGISIVGIILIGILVIILLGYFNINLRTVVENPQSQDNLNYLREGTVNLWNKYLKAPASYLWNDVWLKIFWRPFISNMERIRDGKPTDYELNSPTVKMNY